MIGDPMPRMVGGKYPEIESELGCFQDKKETYFDVQHRWGLQVQLMASPVMALLFPSHVFCFVFVGM